MSNRFDLLAKALAESLGIREAGGWSQALRRLGGRLLRPTHGERFDLDELARDVAEGMPRREALRRLGLGAAAALLSSLGLKPAAGQTPPPPKSCSDADLTDCIYFAEVLCYRAVTFCEKEAERLFNEGIAQCRTLDVINGIFCARRVTAARDAALLRCASLADKCRLIEPRCRDQYGCPNGGICCSGACFPAGTSCCPDGSTCGPWLTCCSPGNTGSYGCFNLWTDAFHCGQCNTVCTGGTICSDRACVCPDGTVDCSGNCFNTATDPSHCGVCGNVCRTGYSCRNGICVLDCPPGAIDCGGACVNTGTDVKHCGGCGQACVAPDAAITVCSNGQCGFDCLRGYDNCDGNPATGCESSLLGDLRNCGACGVMCTGGKVCTGGACVCPDGTMESQGVCCPTGTVNCDEACVDTASDGNNCGGCGTICQGGTSCSGGRCVCPSGQSDCGGVCRDLQADSAHCGACNTACPSGQSCVNGTCACASGSFHCPPNGCCADGSACCSGACFPAGSACCPDGTTCPAGTTCCSPPGTSGSTICANTQTDLEHCGGCNVVCSGGTLCSAGSCVCPTGKALCGGATCLDLQNDPGHCGACSTVCVSGESCVNGQCSCGGGVACPAGQICCGGMCKDPQNDRAHCGSCGRACASGLVCITGVCQVCPAGYTACNGVCTNLMSDPNNCNYCGRVCSAGNTGYDACCGGVCVNLQTYPYHCGVCGNACGPDELCCSGKCIDRWTDVNHCGYCSRACPSPQICVNGQCKICCSDGRCHNTEGQPAQCCPDSNNAVGGPYACADTSGKGLMPVCCPPVPGLTGNRCCNYGEGCSNGYCVQA